MRLFCWYQRMNNGFFDRLHSPNSATVSALYTPHCSLHCSLTPKMNMNPADKGKRKMNANANASSPLPPIHFTSPRLPLDSHFSQVQQILNTAAVNKPFSYMSLLTAPDDHIQPLFNQRSQIDHIISLHSENLKQQLQDIQREAEERSAKRESELLQQNARLQSVADHYKAQAERMVIRVRTLERTTRTLSERLDEAYAAAEEEEEEAAESSFPDPERVEPITLECKVCERKMATVMMWPCRHICVCTRCDARITYCPVCHVVKTNSIQVNIPLN